MRTRPEGHPKSWNCSAKSIAMVGAPPDARGGIASVVASYRDIGLFSQFRIRYFATFSHGGTIEKFRVAFQSWLAFTWALARGELHLAHIHSSSRRSFLRKSIFVWSARLFRLPVIFHLHGGHFFKFYENECGPLRRWYVRCVLRQVNRIAVLTSGIRDQMTEIFGCTNVVILNNPVKRPDDYTRAADPSIRGGIVFFLGRIEAEKGVLLLVDACAELAKQFPDLRLVVAGDGDIATVQEKAGRAGIADRMELVGWLNADAKWEWLSRAAILALPSFDEALPMAVIEAMAAGVPVVASRVGGIPDMLDDGVEGLLVPVGEVQPLSEALARLLADSERREAAGRAGQMRWRRQFSPESASASVQALYAEFGVLPR